MRTDHHHPSERWQARLPFFYGWIVVAASFVTHFVQVGIQLWALSVFVGPMTQELTEWSRSDIFGAVTVRVLISAAGVPLIGRLIDRPNGAVILSCIASGLGGLVLVALAWVNHPWEFMVLYGVVGGMAWVGQTNIISAAILPKWFVRRRSIAMAIGTTGGGFAALVLPLIAAMTITAVGWRDAWVIYGILTIVIGTPLALLLKRQPEDFGLSPDGATVPNTRNRRQNREPSGLTVREAVRMRTTWLLIAAVALASLPSIGIPANMVPLYVDRGFSQTGGALALSVYGLMSVSGRYVWGYVAARTTVRMSFLALVAMGVGVMTLFGVVEDNKPILLGLAAGSGLVIGGMIVLNPLVWPAYLGRAHLGAIQGIVYPIVSLSSAAGPVVLSYAFDRTGTYSAGLWVIVVTYALAFLVMMVVPNPRSSSS